MPKRPEDRANLRMVHILISKTVHKRLQLRCVYEEISIQKYVAGLIERDMNPYRLPGEAKGKRRK